MSVEEAAGFFTEKAVVPMLGALGDVGLGYLSAATAPHIGRDPPAVGGRRSARGGIPDAERAQYRPGVSDRSAQAWSEGDDVRRLVPLFALSVAVVAALADPASSPDLIFAAIPVAVFALWAYAPRAPLAAVGLAVVIPVVAAQRGGALEPLMFDASLLAFVAGRWSRSPFEAVGVGLLAAASPVAAALIQDPAEITVPIWLLGIVFPWTIGQAVARQLRLAAELDATRRELSEQALLAERRRTARDFHDAAGHGLAAVMLQITSARHVLHRDPAAAEEALRSAEDIGRQSMKELRRTVALLRSEEAAGAGPPRPSAGEVPALVEHARAAGLAVDLQIHGDLGRVAPEVGMALYRVAQEALANAARHAPNARTVLGLELTDQRVRLDVATRGRGLSAPAGERGRSGFGLIGMRERVTACGGEFAAGPTPDGWRVRASLPLAAASDANGEPSG
jgi:signal transduction histidine kinase